MAYISHTPAIDMGSDTWFILARKNGVFTEMLKRILSELESMLSHHNKIHVLRFDLHHPDYSDNSQRITKFNRRLLGKIKTKYKVKRIGYAWVREQEEAPSQHYHGVLILDGNKVRHPKKILKMMRDTWEHLEGTCWTPSNCYYNLARDDDRTLQNVIFRISYLAKATGKDKRPLQAKRYSTSRIKPRAIN